MERNNGESEMKRKIVAAILGLLLGVIIAPLFPLILAVFCYNKTDGE